MLVVSFSGCLFFVFLGVIKLVYFVSFTTVKRSSPKLPRPTVSAMSTGPFFDSVQFYVAPTIGITLFGVELP